MNKDNILDEGNHQNFQEYLFDNEKIVWVGKPAFKIDNIFIDRDSNGKITMESLAGILTYIFFVCFVAHYFYAQGDTMIMIGVLMLGLVIPLSPQVLLYKELVNTKYAFTEERVLFKLWKWGKTIVHIIDFEDIHNITYEAYAENKGIIHFIPKKTFNFDTYNLEAGGKRLYPTFENVDEVIELTKILNKHRIACLKK